jgi:cell division protein FtsI/penicillin-binding protein 2
MRSTNRLKTIGIICSVVAVLIVLQMFRIQTSASAQTIRQSEGAIWEETVYPERGNIYDRWGHLMAGNNEVYEVGIDLRSVPDPETIARDVSRILGLDYNEVLTKASLEYDDETVITPQTAMYVRLADFVSPEQINELDTLYEQYQIMADENDQKLFKAEYIPSLKGLTWIPHLRRSYPENFLAANVIGYFSFWDREEGGPHFGVEEYYDDLLAGTPILISQQLDPSKITELPNIPPGASLILTIDNQIQEMSERMIDHAVEETQSVSGTILILDPETGEILSMATSKRINPNDYGNYPDLLVNGYGYNPAVDTPYEPGSVFKVITMAAALDAHVVEPTTEFLDTGYIEVGGYTIYNWDRSAWGPQDMVGCLQHSLNVCLAWVSTQKLGATLFYQYLDAFGIGHRTGIDLAGEQIFPLSVPGDGSWYEVNLGTNAFGQGLATTPIQLASAISAVANDGRIMAPHILRTFINGDQKTDILPRVIASPISADTAHTLTEMLAVSLETEASTALVNGYRVAGKTGTAEISEQGGYTLDVTNASFVGWGPVDDPKFLVYIWLEKPQTSKWGSVVAAPLFSKVVTELVTLMNIPPDSVRQQLYNP